MRRRPPAWLPPIALVRGGEPLHRQIARQIAAAIRADGAGHRLPSTRVLATLLGVSRNTVVAAYEELAADDLIASRHGAGAVTAGARSPGALHRYDPEATMRAAHYPRRSAWFADPDGNAIYVGF